MIEDYPLSQRPLWELLSREVLAITATGMLFPMGLKRTPRRTRRQADQRTVVLLHGYLLNSSALFPLKAYLRTQGIGQILTFNYSSTYGIERSAIDLKNYLQQYVRGGRIDLVCHSLGGLVARSYLQHLGGARRVDRCITLGTPHRGTYNAYWVASKVGRELRPDSALLKKLDATRTKASNVRFTSIVAGSDNMIIPRVFAANEDTVHLPDLGHMSMLFSPTVFRTVVARLLTPP